jgi:glycosyltransferase involved in cell wall biosynthesis
MIVARPIELSVVVPVFQNGDTVRALVERLRATLSPRDVLFEVVFVDDACPAGSWPVLASLADESDEVRAVGLARNLGQHAAVLVGLAYARGAWCAVMDADLQDAPETLPALLDARLPGVAAVFGGRTGRYEAPGRLVTARLYRQTLNRLCGLPPDAGIYALVRRDLVAALVAMRVRRPSIVAMIGLVGMRAVSIPVRRAPRPHGTSSYGGRARLRSAARAFGCVLDVRLGRVARPYLDTLEPGIVARAAGGDATRRRISTPSALVETTS